MNPHEPCPTCPWRKSSTVGGFDIPNFRLDMMRGLRRCVGHGDAMRRIMACHHSKPGKEVACRGYVAQEGMSNINVRILASQGVIPFKEIVDACAGLDLWPSFEAMLAAYEAARR